MPYDILNVHSTADKTTIEGGYKKIALTLHPDKVPQAKQKEAEFYFKIINEAKETLLKASFG